MGKEWTERDKGFEWFYSNLTSEYKGKHFEPTPGIAGYINDMIVTPMHLRQMDEAYYEHLKVKPHDSVMLPFPVTLEMPKRMLANQYVCPGTVCMDTQDGMRVTQTFRGSEVIRIVAEYL